MTIHIPMWVIDTASVLGIVVLAALAVLGVVFIWFMFTFKDFK
jgi:hypothetical protein